MKNSIISNFFGQSDKTKEEMLALQAKHSLKTERMNDAAIVSTDLEFNWQYAEVIQSP